MLLLIFSCLKETNQNKIALNIKNIAGNYRQILTHKVFMNSLIILGINYSLMIIFNIIAPFLIQSVLGYTAIVYAHMALYMGVAFLIGSLTNQVLIRHFKIHTLIKTGFIISIITSSVMLILTHIIPINLATITVPVYIIVFCIALINPNLMGEIMAIFPKSGGTVAAIIGCMIIVCALISSGIASLIHSLNQIPMAWLYTVLIVINCLIYGLVIRKKDEA